MPGGNHLSQLLVEGKNDQHVIWALCKQHDVKETFSVETVDSKNRESLLNSIPVRLKISGLQSLGIVLDADQNVGGSWDAICDRLTRVGYISLPQEPDPNGTLIESIGKPKVGIWIMPDNQMPGMLENFVAHLIPDTDLLALKAEAVLQEIEQESLHRYSLSHRPKAFIHTWLAWQKVPGQPMGLAITAHILNHNEALALSFVSWLRRLFE